MHPSSTPTGAPRKGLAARLALAVALTGGLAIGGTALPAPAFAKDKKKEAPGKPGNTKAFVEAYKPVADIANAPDGDYAAAKAQLPAVIAAIGNETDRNAAGQLTLVLGNKLTDRALQRQGLELMLQSGQADPDKVGQYQFFVGNLAYEAKDYAAARAALQAAIDAGYTENDPQGMLAATYFESGQVAEGIKYYQDQIAKAKAAGQPVPEAWLRRSLKAAYDAKMQPQINDLSAQLVRDDPSEKSWTDALQVILQTNQLDAQSELDLLRLMRATGTLDQRREYVSYIEAADARKMANEVLAVLDEGVKAGVFTTSDQYYQQTKTLADPRAAADKKDAAATAADAQKAATGITAQGAGDVYFSMGDYAKAAELYQMALDKGVQDRDLALTHLGIAQVDAGNYDAAKAAFQQVNGPRSAVAKMWLAYIDTKTAPPTPPTPPAPPA